MYLSIKCKKAGIHLSEKAVTIPWGIVVFTVSVSKSKYLLKLCLRQWTEIPHVSGSYEYNEC